MKVLLIVPGKLGFSTEGLQSLGIGMIATVLNEVGHEVVMCDLTVQPMSLPEFGWTVETMEQTIRFATELPLDYAQFAIAVPYPGTEMRTEVQEKLCDVPYNKYGAHEGGVYFTTSRLRPDLIKAAFHNAYRRFYLRPSLALRHVRRAITAFHTSDLLQGIKRFLT